MRVLERAATAGGNGWYAGGFCGAGTSWQSALGIEDSPELALSEWEAITGATPDAQVEAMIRGSAELIDWLGGGWGIKVEDVGSEELRATVPRQHRLGLAGEPVIYYLLADIEPLIRTETEATALVWSGDTVVGARFTDLSTGEEGWIEAGAVVIATGGFASAAAQ